MADLARLVLAAECRGATVHLTRHGEAISTVQVLGLAGFTTFPLPVRQAAVELARAVK